MYVASGDIGYEHCQREREFLFRRVPVIRRVPVTARNLSNEFFKFLGLFVDIFGEAKVSVVVMSWFIREIHHRKELVLCLHRMVCCMFFLF